MADSPSAGLRALFSLSTSSCSSETSFLWHCQLGHPSFSKLKETLPWLHLCDYKCESCEVGKHHRSTYSARTSISSKGPFDLVHYDVWGPGSMPRLPEDDITLFLWMTIPKLAGPISSKITRKSSHASSSLLRRSPRSMILI